MSATQTYSFTRCASSRRPGPNTTDGVPARVKKNASELLATWIAFSNPPEHGRRRASVADGLSAPATAGFRRGILEIAVDRMARLGAGEHELVAAFVRPVVQESIALLLGLEPDEAAVAIADGDAIIGYLTAAGWDAGAAARASDAVASLRTLLFDRVLRRGSSPISRCLSGALSGGTLTEHEAVGTFAQLLTGGIEPTTTAIATALSHVPGTRDVTAQSLATESLRFDAPFHFASRIAATDLEIDGTPIRAGDPVKLVIASANRDDAVFEHADAFHPGRRLRSGAILTFGRGAHVCLGALFARAQIEAAVEAFLEAADRVVDLSPPRRRPSFGATSFSALRVRLA